MNTFSFACAANCSFLLEWFRYTKAVMSHPDLRPDEQCLWVWLASHCASTAHHSCSLSYEQISQALNMPTRVIHRALFRLKIVGFLEAPIPIWYGELTPEMNVEKRMLKPLYYSEEELQWQAELRRTVRENRLVMQTYDNRLIQINLLRKNV